MRLIGLAVILALNLIVVPLAAEAQQQIGIFFATEGAVVVDPDGPSPIFEVPIAGPLPETLSFIP